MTVAELIAELQKQDQNARVTVQIADPEDTAYSGDISIELSDDGEVCVYAWVSSDDEDAFAPWAS